MVVMISMIILLVYVLFLKLDVIDFHIILIVVLLGVVIVAFMIDFL